MAKQKFKVTPEHIKLIRHMIVDWQDAEYGAPAIDPKRPYGNSDVEADMLKILVGEREKVPKDLNELHSETQTALQICLCTGSFKPGWYEAPEYTSTEWKKIR